MSKVINTLTWIGLAVIGIPIAITMCSLRDDINDESVYNAGPSTVVQNSIDAKQAASDNISSDTKKDIIKYFMSDKEPMVKDAVWADQLKNTLYIGVIDDGTRRDGFADYVCQVLISDFGLKQGDASVYVMDIVKITRDNKWEQLGRSGCQWQ